MASGTLVVPFVAYQDCTLDNVAFSSSQGCNILVGIMMR